LETVIYVDASFSKDTDSRIAWYNETSDKSFFTKLDCVDSFRCEFQAVLRALEYHKELSEITILMDNQVVADQLTHKSGINHEDALNVAKKIWDLTSDKKVRFLWIPRKQNKAGKMLGS
jgi:ribonuclease HI